jgi:hypothetical protein
VKRRDQVYPSDERPGNRQKIKKVHDDRGQHRKREGGAPAPRACCDRQSEAAEADRHGAKMQQHARAGRCGRCVELRGRKQTKPAGAAAIQDCDAHGATAEQ